MKQGLFTNCYSTVHVASGQAWRAFMHRPTQLLQKHFLFIKL